jgi:hypothetical protein
MDEYHNTGVVDLCICTVDDSISCNDVSTASSMLLSLTITPTALPATVQSAWMYEQLRPEEEKGRADRRDD